MRKAILTVGAACLLASVMASSAFAEPSTYQNFTVRMVGKAGTAKKPGSVGTYLNPWHTIKQAPACAVTANSADCKNNTYGIGAVLGGALAEPTFATMEAHIYLPKEMTLATTGFPECPIADAVASDRPKKDGVKVPGLPKCPKGSVIGSGIAAGYARNADAAAGTYTAKVAPTVDVAILKPQAKTGIYPAVGKNTIGLRTYHVLTGKGLITGVIGKATGAEAKKYGTDITFSIPRGLVNPSGTLMSQLSAFDSTIAPVKNKKGQPLQGLTGCPKSGKLTFGYRGIYNVGLDTTKEPKIDVGGGLVLSVDEVGPIIEQKVACKK